MLISSFTTWKLHHTTNASDDLLQRAIGKVPFHYLRRLPVDAEAATQEVLDHFNRLKPGTLLCCGMAEKRSELNVESRATLQGKTLHTGVDLEWLVDGLPMTGISRDAGDFVCNHLYYRLLDHLQTQPGKHQCLFVHVPLLTQDNSHQLEADFISIIERLQQKYGQSE